VMTLPNCSSPGALDDLCLNSVVTDNTIECLDRLNQIYFHTLRHWKATIESHKTKDVLYVKRLLGHIKLENTEIYTHLINFERDEWHVAHAKNLEEENKLIEAGFDYVRYSDKYKVAIYRKRK
jgi:hypothetical protein